MRLFEHFEELLAELSDVVLVYGDRFEAVRTSLHGKVNISVPGDDWPIKLPRPEKFGGILDLFAQYPHNACLRDFILAGAEDYYRVRCPDSPYEDVEAFLLAYARAMHGQEDANVSMKDSFGAYVLDVTESRTKRHSQNG